MAQPGRNRLLPKAGTPAGSAKVRAYSFHSGQPSKTAFRARTALTVPSKPCRRWPAARPALPP